MPSSEDAIELKRMSFYGYHGVHPEEERLGQPFLVTLVLTLSLREAGMTDDLQKTVDYGKVYQLVREQVVEKRYNLLEALSQAIAREVLSSFPKVQEVQVLVEKPSPPIPGILEGVVVQITRRREEWRESS